MSASPLATPGQTQDLSLSPAGRNQLMQREGVVHHYYDDTVHNCTYGAGTLAHLGPCTPAELHRPVTNAQILSGMQNGIRVAEAAVRRNVTRQHLTQAQFDALVSFAYNVGGAGGRGVFHEVNAGHLQQAARTIRQYVHATVRGRDGHALRDRNGRVVTRILHGLVRRRRAESAPFEAIHQAHPANSTAHSNRVTGPGASVQQNPRRLP